MEEWFDEIFYEKKILGVFVKNMLENFEIFVFI